jgi:hypothetical protein
MLTSIKKEKQKCQTILGLARVVLEYGPILKRKRRVKGKAKKLNWP